MSADTSKTELETKVYDFIVQATNDDPAGWGPMLGEIVRGLGMEKESVKGVLGSLTAKGLVVPVKEDGYPTVYCLPETL